jgi:integrase
VPYIYSRDELQRLLDATETLEDSRLPLQHATFRTMLLVLYGAGLRPSEGLRLRCCDVNLDERVLAIWDTKFFKSRLVPIGTALVAALGMYGKARRRLPMPAGIRSAFFALPTGGPIMLNGLEKVFARLREHAGVQSPPGARWQPRLHDLRHTFAVHRLIAWYREGTDVQACLPLLSTYLGHVNVSGTQAYLTMTPELLSEASKRFERYAAIGEEEEYDA